MRELILGIDPSIQNIPDIYKRNQTVDIIISWGADLIEACKDKVAGVKFQIAYFENLGLDGLIALAKLIHIAKEQKLKTIMMQSVEILAQRLPPMRKRICQMKMRLGPTTSHVIT